MSVNTTMYLLYSYISKRGGTSAPTVPEQDMFSIFTTPWGI